MPFINEYISSSDIEKYGIAKAYFAAYPDQTELPENFRPHWTIDRERQIILRQMRGANPARDGEYWIEFLLEMNGQKVFVKIDRMDGSKKLSDSPYLIAWGKIIDVYPNDLAEDQLREVTSILKEALTARGYDGARKQIPNTIVTFDF